MKWPSLATAAAGNPRRADLLATVASVQRWLAASTSAWADAAAFQRRPSLDH